MKIVKVVCAPGRTGFYFDDQMAIKQGAKMDGFFYDGAPETSGFTAIRQAGESISIMLVLENGSIAWGDCAAVQYSGAGGRDPLFLAEDFIPVIMRDIQEALLFSSLFLLIPFIRSYIHTISCQDGRPAVIVPVINVTHLLNSHLDDDEE
jgi:methylaspartate ammonia-lyase